MLANLSAKLANYIANGQFSVLFLVVSFLGGVLSSISPCSIGVLPLIVGYVGGYGDSDKFKTFIQMCSFVFGLGLVLSVIGVICALTGNVFTSVGGVYWILIIASLILVMGLNLLGLIHLPISPLVKKLPKGNSASLFFYPVLIGILFAFATSPCSTPILAGIMGFASLTKNIALSALMLLCFSLGQGIIVILAGVFTSFLKGLRNFAQTSEILLKISGILLTIAAIIIYIQVFSKFLIK